MAGHKTDDGEAEPPVRKPSSSERDKGQHGRSHHRRAEPKSRDIDLERVLYDPEYRQAVQETLSPDTPPGRPPRDVKPQKG